jgi:apolipoprotein N-acyltransferase
MMLFNDSRGRILAGVFASILISALLSGLYARGGAGWWLGFVILVPWLRSLDARRTLAGTLLCAYVMSVAFTAAVFAWFGIAIGNYTQVGAATGLSVLLLAAPLFQPQILVFALVRHVAGRWRGPVLGAFAGAAAWVATEWLVPRLLGDTLGYGLYPSRMLRQGADVGGAAGLTFLLLLANEAVAAALARRAGGVRAMIKPLALAALAPMLLAGYGFGVLSARPAIVGKPLRMGLVQSNIVDYERRRQATGAYQVVRKVLDTHFAMTYDAVVRQHADAVLWSETAYPTTFGHPKSETGAELDREILGIVNSAGVPFVFGTYDRDAAGEYNAAAFVGPGTGLLGLYRKTRLFPLTEYVPAWLDGPVLRRWLPWAGTWHLGNGARVFPLRLADGREIPVLPLICLDDVDAGLGIDGARLGAQAILTMSNDAWFTDYPQGAQLHQAVAAFRSIETRLPQFRVTTNGYSGVIDATGSVIAGAGMGQQTLVIGEVQVRAPPRTLMVAWGDWVGFAGLGFLVLLAMMAVMEGMAQWFARQRPHVQDAANVMVFPVKVALLPPAARLAAGLLRSFARASLLWMGAAMLFNDALRGNTLAQIRTFAALFLAPEAAAWCVLSAFAARGSLENGVLILTSGARRIELAVRDIVAVEPWRAPMPSPGVWLRLASGQRWRYGLAFASRTNPAALTKALVAAGGAAAEQDTASREAMREVIYRQARLAMRRGWLDQAYAKFVLLPFALALPAFYLHQHIAYGSGFGEYISFGLKAYLTAFALWWAAWVIGVTLSGAALRAVIEAGTLLTVLVRPARAIDIRRWLERFGNAALYLGLPAWLLLRIYGP